MTLVVAGMLVSPLTATADTAAQPVAALPADVADLSAVAMSAFAASTPLNHGAPAPATSAVLSAAALGSRPVQVAASSGAEPGAVPGGAAGGVGAGSGGNGTAALGPGDAQMVAAGASAPRVGQSAVNAAAPVQRLGDRVIVRKPARDYGSGFLGDYGKLSRVTASKKQFRAAAASDNGCLIIGDSIASMSKDVLVADLARRHSGVCAWDTWSGRPTEGTANALADIKAAHGLPPTIIVMSGSNDIFNPPLFAAQVRRVLAVSEGSRVIWVNVFARRVVARRYAADLRNSILINRTLAAVVRQKPTVQVIDWYGFVTSRTRRGNIYLLDGIHPNKPGQRALSNLVARAW